MRDDSGLPKSNGSIPSVVDGFPSISRIIPKASGSSGEEDEEGGGGDDDKGGDVAGSAIY